MKKSNPFERISAALGGEQGLRRLRDVFGIPSFCYNSPIGWIDLITMEDYIFQTSFAEEAPASPPRFPSDIPVLIRTIKLLDLYFAGGPD